MHDKALTKAASSASFTIKLNYALILPISAFVCEALGITSIFKMLVFFGPDMLSFTGPFKFSNSSRYAQKKGDHPILEIAFSVSHYVNIILA